jgi:parvulin-like peptidyl-prolyl isomerase
MNKLLSLLFALVLVAALAGCGGESAKLASDDVAVVGSEHIQKSDFDALLTQAKQSFKQQNRPFPKAGTSDYATIRNQAVTLLTQQAERAQKAKDMGVEVSDKDVDKRLAAIKKQYFHGSQKSYEQQLKKQGLTDEQVRRDIKAQLISDGIFKKVTGKVKVSDADVHSYYIQHPQLYAQPQTRDVRHILVKKNQKALAESLYAQLKAGGDWCKLAKKYSQDPGSKTQCGKLTVSKGQTVPPFDKISFSIKTNEIAKPVLTTYGWHVIQALSIIHPRKTTPEKQVAASIKQQLVQQKKNEEMTSWVNGITKDFCKGSKVKYKEGYKPSPDPCAALTLSTSTT